MLFSTPVWLGLGRGCSGCLVKGVVKGVVKGGCGGRDVIGHLPVGARNMQSLTLLHSRALSCA